MINQFKQLRFFLVAAALVSVVSSTAFAAVGFESKDDPNDSIGQSFVSDNAAGSALRINCHDCEIAAQSSKPLNDTFEPRGSTQDGGTTGGEAGKPTKQ